MKFETLLFRLKIYFIQYVSNLLMLTLFCFKKNIFYQYMSNLLMLYKSMFINWFKPKNKNIEDMIRNS